jgi:HK97 family phage major capsid protein
MTSTADRPDIAALTAAIQATCRRRLEAFDGEPGRRQYARFQEARAELSDQVDQVLDAAHDAGRALSDEETEALDSADVRLRELRDAIAHHEAYRDEVRGLVEQRDRLRDSAGFGESLGRSAIALPAGRFGNRTYREMFGATSSDGWRDREEFFATIHQQLNDPRLRPAMLAFDAIATGTNPADGGFSVPTEFVAEMLDASLEDEIVRPLADVVPMSSSTKMVSGFDSGSAAGGTLYGGFTGQWVEEGGEITAKTPQMRRVQLTAKKLALLTQVSNELLADGDGYGTQLEGALVKAIGWFLDTAFLTGTGAGQPLGVLHDPALITVAKEDGQAKQTIDYLNLTKMFARIHPASINRAVWVANATAIPQLLTLTIAVGTGGSVVPVLTESNGQFRMLTRPVLFTEKLPAVGTVGDILLADFSQYKIGLRQGMSVDRSSHAGFTSNTTYVRGILRGDGQGKWGAPYTPAAGDTLSWCVALATRP